jgi:DNA-binding response OmpR family regulator
MEHASPPIEASSQDRSVVLLVDDERGPRESLRMILRPGYDVLTARDGQEAMRVLRTNRVDLVTLDLNMPGVHGTELMRTLRREFPEVEIVVVTGNPCIESATEALRYGIGDYLQKPFDVVQVTAAVYRCLSRRRGRRRLTSFLDGLAEVVGYEGDATQVLSQAKGDPRRSVAPSSSWRCWQTRSRARAPSCAATPGAPPSTRVRWRTASGSPRRSANTFA